MRKRPAGIIIISLFFLLPFAATAQNYTVKESSSLEDDFLHVFFKTGSDHYISLNYAAPHGAFSYKREDRYTTVVLYDKSLRQVHTVPVKEMAGKKYESSLEFDKHIQIFYSDINRTLYRCEFDGMKGALIGDPVELFTIPNENAGFIKGFSADSSYSFQLCRSYEKNGKNMIYNGIVMDREMHIVTKFSFMLEGLREYIANTECVLSNKGLPFIITAVRVKSSKADYHPLQYIVTEVNSEGKSVNTPINELPEGLLANVKWYMGEKGLSFTGLLAKNKKDGFTSIVNGNYDSWQKKTSIKAIDFGSASFFKNASAKYLKEIMKDGVPADADLVGSYVLKDGAIIFVLQTSEIITRGQGSFVYSDTKAGSLYVVRISAEKELDWLQIVPKNQIEPSTPVFTGAICMPDNKDGLYIFFHDHDNNDKVEPGGHATWARLEGAWKNLSLAAVHIMKDGTFDKKFIVDDYETDLLLCPTNTFTFYDNELIYTSLNLKHIGKSKFRIGTIKVAAK